LSPRLDPEGAIAPFARPLDGRVDEGATGAQSAEGDIDGEVRDLSGVGPRGDDDHEEASQHAVDFGGEEEVRGFECLSQPVQRVGRVDGHRRGDAVAPAEGEGMFGRLAGALKREEAVSGIGEVESGERGEVGFGGRADREGHRSRSA